MILVTYIINLQNSVLSKALYHLTLKIAKCPLKFLNGLSDKKMNSV